MNIKIKIHWNYLIFISAVLSILKLMGRVSWSWAWVLAPLWVPWGLFFGLVAIFVIIEIILSMWGD